MDKIYLLDNLNYLSIKTKYDNLFIKQVLLSNFNILFKKCCTITKMILNNLINNSELNFYKTILKELRNF